MSIGLRKPLLIILGWVFILLAGIGVFLPILPTTPFLIVALALFSKSSPRFHQMLLRNSLFGPSLRQWEETKTVSAKSKRKAYFLIVISFTLSIAILGDRTELQLMLLAIGMVLVFFIRRVKEEA